MSLAQIDSYCSTALAAIEAGDFDAAIRAATQCKLLLATTPGISRGLSGGGSQSLAWSNAAQIESFIADCRRLKAEAAATNYGLQQTKIHYRRPTSCEE